MRILLGQCWQVLTYRNRSAFQLTKRRVFLDVFSVFFVQWDLHGPYGDWSFDSL